MAKLALVADQPPKPACSLCIHAAFGPFGVHCTEFHEDVDDKVAEECPMYEIDSIHVKVKKARG